MRAADRGAGAIARVHLLPWPAEPCVPAHIVAVRMSSPDIPGPVARRTVMPARSKKQQMAAGAALAAKRGERSKESLKGASRQMVESMNEQQLREFAHTRRKSLPRKRKG